jgi:hypothetical protein
MSTTLSPVLADASSLLRENIRAHLEEAELLAVQNAEWSAEDMDTARGPICALVLTIRGADDGAQATERR